MYFSSHLVFHLPPTLPCSPTKLLYLLFDLVTNNFLGLHFSITMCDAVFTSKPNVYNKYFCSSLSNFCCLSHPHISTLYIIILHTTPSNNIILDLKSLHFFHSSIIVFPLSYASHFSRSCGVPFQRHFIYFNVNCVICPWRYFWSARKLDIKILVCTH